MKKISGIQRLAITSWFKLTSDTRDSDKELSTVLEERGYNPDVNELTYDEAVELIKGFKMLF